jgi:hypothetical protein
MSYTGKDSKTWNPFSTEIWIAWLGATAVGVAGMTTFLYFNFETKDSFADYKQNQSQTQEEIIKRLDRMEDKIDRLLSLRRN